MCHKSRAAPAYLTIINWEQTNNAWVLASPFDVCPRQELPFPRHSRHSPRREVVGSIDRLRAKQLCAAAAEGCVALPVQCNITRYLEATGNTAPMRWLRR
jgi:hypothetical protein